MLITYLIETPVFLSFFLLHLYLFICKERISISISISRVMLNVILTHQNILIFILPLHLTLHPTWLHHIFYFNIQYKTQIKPFFFFLFLHLCINPNQPNQIQHQTQTDQTRTNPATTTHNLEKPIITQQSNLNRPSTAAHNSAPSLSLFNQPNWWCKNQQPSIATHNNHHNPKLKCLNK